MLGSLESKAKIEVHFTYYLIPKYQGLLRAKDVDFFSETTELLVNDDLQEDLK
jgi:hypothetical protein